MGMPKTNGSQISNKEYEQALNLLETLSTDDVLDLIVEWFENRRAGIRFVNALIRRLN